MARKRYLQPGDAGFSYTTTVVNDRLIVVEDEGVVRREADGENIGKELVEDGFDVMAMPVLHVDDEGTCRRLFVDTMGNKIGWVPIPGACGREAGVVAMFEAMARLAARKAAREGAYAEAA